MSLIEFIKSLFSKKPEVKIDSDNFTGALVSEDDAPIKFSDVVASANAVNWQKTSYRSFPAFDQKRSYMCGAFSGKKHLGVCYQQKYTKWIEFSEEDIYQRRGNKGQPGMYLPNLMAIMTNGVTLKALTAVDVNTDDDADNCVIDEWKRDPVGKAFAASEPIYIPHGDFETIASVIQTTGKSVISLMYFTSQEWSAQYPQVLYQGLTYDSNAALHHFINCTDYVNIGGKRYLVIEDSAWFGGLNMRFISEEFFKARNMPVSMANAYIMSFKFEKTDTSKVHFTGTIVSLQECLRALGFFPTNVSFVESVGPTTKGALAKFQAANGLPVTSVFDSDTRALVTRLFP